MQEKELTEKSEIKKERNYGIDLLRLISMLMIVVLHVLGNGGILDATTNLSWKGEVYWALEILCYGAVNIYAIISGYVGYKTKHKATNLITLSLQIAFFAIIVTIADVAILYSNNEPITFSRVISNLFPSVGGYWYFSSYFLLFFFMPVLDKIVECVPRNKLKITALACFLLTISTTFAGIQSGYSFLWLALLYTVGAYIKEYNPYNNMSAGKCFFVFVACILITVLVRILAGVLQSSLFPAISDVNWLVSYTSPTIVVAAIFIFMAFMKTKIGKTFSSIIAFLSPLAFGVYAVHCHPLIFSKMSNIFVWIIDYNVFYGFLLVIACSLAIFVICMLIDWLRLLLFKACRVSVLSKWIEKVVKGFVSFIFKIFHIPTENNRENK